MAAPRNRRARLPAEPASSSGIRLLNGGCAGLAQEARQRLVNGATSYFGAHYGEPIRIASVASRLGVSEGCLDLCFDLCRGRTPWETLQQLRLSRLFEAISEQPGQGIESHVQRCGLLTVTEANQAFQRAFGIDLGSFRHSCRRAAADRRFRRSHPDAADLVLPE
jgi:transcriptional regulator GlxA family with amidase domain